MTMLWLRNNNKYRFGNDSSSLSRVALLLRKPLRKSTVKNIQGEASRRTCDPTEPSNPAFNRWNSNFAAQYSQNSRLRRRRRIVHQRVALSAISYPAQVEKSNESRWSQSWTHAETDAYAAINSRKGITDERSEAVNPRKRSSVTHYVRKLYMAAVRAFSRLFLSSWRAWNARTITEVCALPYSQFRVAKLWLGVNQTDGERSLQLQHANALRSNTVPRIDVAWVRARAIACLCKLDGGAFVLVFCRLTCFVPRHCSYTALCSVVSWLSPPCDASCTLILSASVWLSGFVCFASWTAKRRVRFSTLMATTVSTRPTLRLLLHRTICYWTLLR